MIASLVCIGSCARKADLPEDEDVEEDLEGMTAVVVGVSTGGASAKMLSASKRSST